MELDLSGLESIRLLPQWETLEYLAPRIWQQEGIVALWLGGSLARRQGDIYSDIDFGVAVQPDALDEWRDLNLEIICGTRCVGHQILRLGPDAFLHHLVMSDGTIVDVAIQSVAIDPPPITLHLLGCRDAAFAQRITPNSETPPAAVAADPMIIQQNIVAFWIGSHKHRKVLHRGLDLLAPTGLQIERTALMRLWYTLATGHAEAASSLTIHSLTNIVRVLEKTMGQRPLQVLGQPTTNRAEIVTVIETHRDEVSQVGRILAERLGFAYPEALEATVRQGWQEYLTGD